MGSTKRRAARAILLTPQHEVLLMRMVFPWRNEDLWILPGGGIEPGEDAQSSAAREVLEETGATDITIVGEAWYRDSFVDATNTHLQQRYFLAHTERFEPKPTDLSEAEMDWVREYRWWSIDELTRADVVVEPFRIGKGLVEIVENGLPSTPIEIDAL